MRVATVTATLVVVAAACAPSAGTAATPAPDPSEFSAKITNEWFPLRAGTTWRYRGLADGERAVDVLTVTRGVKKIMGVPCAVIVDRSYIDGKLEESTTDWYTQRDDGTVWYFGEATREVDEHGRTVSREGSWQAGVNGAKPGIFMPKDPRVGQSFRQEFYPGHAEDHFKVVSLRGSVKVPYRAFRGNVLVTSETTPLERGVVNHKYYARGVGLVAERAISGPNETGALVSVTRG